MEVVPLLLYPRGCPSIYVIHSWRCCNIVELQCCCHEVLVAVLVADNLYARSVSSPVVPDTALPYA